MDDHAYASARSLAGAIAAGRLRVSDVLEAMLDRIARVDPPYRSVIVLDTERARMQARAADRAVAAGEPLGPLHGVCMTVKETFDVAGLRTTCCTKLLEQYAPEHDALAVQRLRAAGAIIVGKTNTSEWASDNQSYNELFGTTNNPHDVSRTVGGSSGGSAGALALGLTPIELGSDLGGSIRTPAAYCGVVGHKSSYGIVPVRGMNPPPGAVSAPDIAVVGPMARDCDDAQLLLDAIAGPDDWERVGYTLRLPPPRHTALADYRVAVWLDDPACPIAHESLETLRASVDALASAGARVEEAKPPFGFEEARALFEQLVAGVNSLFFRDDTLDRIFERSRTEPALKRVRGGPAQRHRHWLGANEKRHHMRQKWHEFFKAWDVVLMPVAPDVAFPHDHSAPMHKRTITVDGVTRPYADLFAWVGVVGVAYLPSTSVPVGRTRAGLPVGVQVVGPFLEDRTTLDFGRRLMELRGGFVAPPL